MLRGPLLRLPPKTSRLVFASRRGGWGGVSLGVVPSVPGEGSRRLLSRTQRRLPCGLDFNLCHGGKIQKHPLLPPPPPPSNQPPPPPPLGCFTLEMRAGGLNGRRRHRSKSFCHFKSHLELDLCHSAAVAPQRNEAKQKKKKEVGSNLPPVNRSDLCPPCLS